MTKIKLTALEPDAYSSDHGDYWTECPADLVHVEGLQVGDEFELTVAINVWTETYRVVKAPDNEDDDYEVERIPNPKHQYVTIAQAQEYKDACVREALEKAALNADQQDLVNETNQPKRKQK